MIYIQWLVTLSGFFTLTFNDVVFFFCCFFDAALKGSVLAFGAGCEPSKRVIYFASPNRSLGRTHVSYWSQSDNSAIHTGMSQKQ